MRLTPLREALSWLRALHGHGCLADPDDAHPLELAVSRLGGREELGRLIGRLQAEIEPGPTFEDRLDAAWRSGYAAAIEDLSSSYVGATGTELLVNEEGGLCPGS